MAIKQRNDVGQFLKGSGGRPAGARNKFCAAFLNALASDFDEHGADIIRIVRCEDPSTYLKVVANLVPRELRVEGKPLSDHQLEQMSDDELAAAIEHVRAQLPKEDRPKITTPQGQLYRLENSKDSDANGGPHAKPRS
jgi:hypothetical protein